MLNANLELAARQIVGHGTSCGENRFVFQPLGEAELLDPFPDIRAAAAARIADRFGREQRRLVGFHRADVGFGRAGPHRKPETCAHEWGHCAGNDFTISDELVDLAWISGDEIRRTVGESLLQNGVVGLDDGDLVTARTREPGGEFSYARRRALVGQDNKVGRHGRALRDRYEHSQNARYGEFRARFHASSRQLSTSNWIFENGCEFSGGLSILSILCPTNRLWPDEPLVYNDAHEVVIWNGFSPPADIRFRFGRYFVCVIGTAAGSRRRLPGAGSPQWARDDNGLSRYDSIGDCDSR